jgi:hypothetical protein
MQTPSTQSPSHSHWLGACAAASLVVILLLGFGANYLHPRQHYLSLGRDFHMSMSGWGVSFYSDASYGPYGGSIMGFSDNPNSPQVSGFNLPVYYRHFRWPNGRVMWTLRIMLPLVLLPFTLCPAVWLWQQIRRRPAGT